MAILKIENTKDSCRVLTGSKNAKNENGRHRPGVNATPWGGSVSTPLACCAQEDKSSEFKQEPAFKS